MKSIVKKILIRLGLFYFLRWSRLFLWYQDQVNPKQKWQNDREAVFLRSFFKNRTTNLIFDVGANDGTKAAQFLQLRPKRLICIEPDPKNQQILKARFRFYTNVKIQPVAVSDWSGQRDFFILRDGDCLNSLSGKWKSILEDVSTNRWTNQTVFQGTIQVKTITITQLIEEFGRPDYCKIDVEGHEWECISDLKQPIPVLSFECNLPYFLEESIKCIQHLSKLNHSYVYLFYADGDDFLLNRSSDQSEAISFLSSGRLNYVEIFACICE